MEKENNSQDLSLWMQTGFIIWTLFLIAFSFWLSEKQPDKLWDSFNILNSLVGIFTIILVYFTYKTQKEEIRITNDTFKKQKEIMDEEKIYNQLNFLIQQKERIKELITITQVIYDCNRIEKNREKYYWSLAISKYIHEEEWQEFKIFQNFLQEHWFFFIEYYKISIAINKKIQDSNLSSLENLKFLAIDSLDEKFFNLLEKYNIIDKNSENLKSP